MQDNNGWTVIRWSATLSSLDRAVRRNRKRTTYLTEAPGFHRKRAVGLTANWVTVGGWPSFQYPGCGSGLKVDWTIPGILPIVDVGEGLDKLPDRRAGAAWSRSRMNAAALERIECRCLALNRLQLYR